MTNQHLPNNLADLGVPRRVREPDADLDTLWLTSYPIITNYKKLCETTGLCFLGKGGSLTNIPGSWPVIIQGKHSDGYVLSGYRSKIISGNVNSPHRYGFALDIEIHDPIRQAEVGEIALTWFTRVGFYPGRAFIHVDMAPLNWIKRYAKALFWVQVNGQYHNFTEIGKAVEFMKAA